MVVALLPPLLLLLLLLLLHPRAAPRNIAQRGGRGARVVVVGRGMGFARAGALQKREQGRSRSMARVQRLGWCAIST